MIITSAKFAFRLIRTINCKLKLLKLKLIGCDIAWSASIHPSAVLELSGGSIFIGPKTYIDRGVIIRAMGGSIKIGHSCSVNAYSFLSGAGGLNIANSVMIGSHVSIYASNHAFADISVPMDKQGLTLKGIKIDNDVWVGTGVRILDGIRVRTGSILAAGAVITKSTEPFSVVAGVPGKKIYSRIK